ncbi:NACHT domain-containing protein [Actinoplanes sp. TRM 88003]|uniref:NACHT domain-containing protein n=1 Tax=Paractinoplanes aksuensis TaxID=2939490 RepID=A0ABT1DPP5_9ACTN|nr:NACHT domain-containing protein [Actinoplanes aksuensis]MCO8272817.1 NACHT domain-containing protein [Actinoplanes aksuensis]
MLEAVAAEVLGSVVMGAGARVGKQVAGAVRRRRGRETDEDTVAGLLAAERALDSKRLIAVDFPAGLDAGRFRALMSDPATEAIAFELMTVMLTGAPAASAEPILSRWLADGGRLLPDFSQAVRTKFQREIFAALRDECEHVTGTVERDFPDVAAKFKEQANFDRIAAILEAIERKTSDIASTPNKLDANEQQRFLESYRAQAIAAHGFITPPDFERRRRVPIADIYVSPSIKKSGLGQQKATLRRIEDLIRQIDRTVLLGDPGNGKSTAASVTMFTEASKSDGLIPFMVILREFASDADLTESIVEHIEKRLRVAYQCPAPAGLINHLLDAGRCLIIFDGLDELLDTTKRRAVTDAVELFCRRYPLSRVLVTSRRVGYLQAPMDTKQFETFEIDGFDADRTEEYVKKWFQQDDSLTEEEASSWTDSFMEESEQVQDLRSVPLLLALMCIIYRGEQSIPRNRPAVYERCATMLFEKWDSHRKIHVELRVGRLVDPAMKFLGYWMLTQSDKTEGVTEGVLIQQTSAYLQQHDFEDAHEAEAAAKEFVEFCRGRAWVFSDAGSTADGEPLYKFTHRTFMEYFAGYYLTRAYDTPEKLAKSLASKVANAEWDVVAQLALQIEDKHKEAGAERFYKYLLEERVRRSQDKRCNLLSFLCRCLPFVTVKHSTLRQLINQVVAKIAVSTPVLTPTGVFAAYSALDALIISAIGPRRSLVETELQANILKHAKSEDQAEVTAALRLAALGWVATFTRDTAVYFPGGESDQRLFAFYAETFDSAYAASKPALRGDEIISCFAWTRGTISIRQISSGQQNSVDLLRPLWRQLSLPGNFLGFSPLAVGLARWFINGYFPGHFFADNPERMISEIGAFVRELEKPHLLSPKAREVTTSLTRIAAESDETLPSVSSLPLNVQIGGMWILMSTFIKSEMRARRILRDNNPTAERIRLAAALVGEEMSVSEAVESGKISEDAGREISRWFANKPPLKIIPSQTRRQATRAATNTTIESDTYFE